MTDKAKPKRISRRTREMLNREQAAAKAWDKGSKRVK
jgi:hypothetical protein